MNATKNKTSGMVSVVILLLITMIPARYLHPLFSAQVSEAQYCAGPVPEIGNLRCLIGLYQYDNNRLPGMGLKSGGTRGETSQLADGLSHVQTLSGTEPAAWTVDFGKTVAVNNGNHFAREIGVDAKEQLVGTRIRPQHVQYRADFSETNCYLYAVGVFGDGDGLKAATGYG